MSIEIQEMEGTIPESVPERLFVEPKSGLVAPESKWRSIVKNQYGDDCRKIRLIQCVIKDGVFYAVGRESGQFIVMTNEGTMQEGPLC